MNKRIIGIICFCLCLGIILYLPIGKAPDNNTNAPINELPSKEAQQAPVSSEEILPLAGVTDEQAGNLQKICKVWGFTKYTHQAFLTGQKDWDEELLSLIPIIQFAGEDEVNDILYNWFIGLGDDGYDGPDTEIMYGHEQLKWKAACQNKN